MFAPINGVIPGMSEALMMMEEGDIWELYVPPELGYQDNDYGIIPAGSTLVYKLELVRILEPVKKLTEEDVVREAMKEKKKKKNSKTKKKHSTTTSNNNRDGEL